MSTVKPLFESSLRPRFGKIFRLVYRNRSVKFTKEGTRFILLTLGVGVAAINTGNNLLYLILAMMLSLIMVSGILSEQCLRKIHVQRKIPSQLFAETPFTLDLVVGNSKRFFPSFSLQIQDSLQGASVTRSTFFFILPPKGQVHGGYPVTLARRGLYRMDTVKLHTRFPFGLFIKTLRYPLKDEFIVYPKIDPVSSILTPLSSRKDETEINKRGQGTTLYQLRNYQEGDDARAIHWKTTARHSKLLIKEHETEEEKRVVLLFDNRDEEGLVEKDPLRFEKGVSLTASLAYHFTQRGFTLEVITADAHFPFAKGAQHLQRILHYLALVKPQRKGSLVEKLRWGNGTSQDYRFLILGHQAHSWTGKEQLFTRVFNSHPSRPSPLRADR
jgi:uncharacterized protein (DUF58 family)